MQRRVFDVTLRKIYPLERITFPLPSDPGSRYITAYSARSDPRTVEF